MVDFELSIFLNALLISLFLAPESSSVKITSHTVITTPPVEHQIQEKELFTTLLFRPGTAYPH